LQTNTAIYQDVFSCVPNDLIHTRYVDVIVVIIIIIIILFYL